MHLIKWRRMIRVSRWNGRDHCCESSVMAWEWVSPVITGAVGVAGIGFTWFTGYQARMHVERMAETARRSTAHAKLLDERRNAYISTLRVAELDLRRERYKRDGETEKLNEIESKWPKSARVEMTHEALILIELFGSTEARSLVATWQAASQINDEQARSAYNDFRAMSRRELASQQTELPDQ